MSHSGRKSAPHGAKRCYTPGELRQIAAEDPMPLLDIALMQIGQLQRRACEATPMRVQLKEKDRRIAELEKKLAEAKTASCRQAAPFRKPGEKRSSNPRRPGRKAIKEAREIKPALAGGFPRRLPPPSQGRDQLEEGKTSQTPGRLCQSTRRS